MGSKGGIREKWWEILGGMRGGNKGIGGKLKGKKGERLPEGNDEVKQGGIWEMRGK